MSASQTSVADTEDERYVTFRDLVEFDDICCDLLVDKLFLGFKTHKMSPDYAKYCQDVEDSQSGFLRDVLPVIQHTVIKNRNPLAAAQYLLRRLCRSFPHPDRPDESELTSHHVFDLQKYVTSLAKSKPHAEEFVEHLKRYLQMYDPSAGYEVCRTYRYKITGKAEACLIATKHWKKGEEISLCTGIIAELTQSQEQFLKDRDHSVMYSSRGDCTCLFLGPARFVNHDCKANCKFSPFSNNLITFRVERDIYPGEEITAFYASHYFGENNSECLCVSCELGQRGGYGAEGGLDRSARRRTPTLSPSRDKKTLACSDCQNDIQEISEDKFRIPKKAKLPDGYRDRRPGLSQQFIPLDQEGRPMCCRCYRHRMLYNLPWPMRLPEEELTCMPGLQFENPRSIFTPRPITKCK